MSLSFLARKPDSGLGNIRSSPGDPSRNVDWVLMTVQFALTVIGCFVVFSAFDFSAWKLPFSPKGTVIWALNDKNLVFRVHQDRTDNVDHAIRGC